MTNIIVGDMYRYPMKSGKADALASINLTNDGIDGDRDWMVVDENRVQITAREAPLLLTVTAKELPDGSISLSAPEHPSIVGSVTRNKFGATLFNTPLQVLDADKVTANWFSELLGRPARLVRRFAATQRNYGNGTYDRFGDFAPILIINKSSLNALNEQLPHPVETNRFRPNIVLENAFAHAEDSWDELVIGNTILKIVEPCPRCVLTTIDPINGLRDLSQQPLRALSRYRATDSGKIHFGVYAQVIKAGKIKKGDKVQIQPRLEPRVYNIQMPLHAAPTDHRVLRLMHAEHAADNARHLWWKFDDAQPTKIQAGQFVSLRVPQSDGTQLARSFTISDQRDGGRSIRLSVRQQGTGGVSDYMVHTAKAGDTIWATGVHGDFVMPSTTDPALFISAGSGVTPFLAFIPHLNETSDIHHIHLDRTSDRAIGAEKLRHANSNLLGYNLRTQWTKNEGRLKPNQLAVIPNLSIRQIWICGPGAFVDDVRMMLKNLGIPDEHIQFETFAAPDEGQTTNRFHTVILDDGPPIKVDAGLSLLSALRAAGQTLASSCEVGSCQSCVLRLIEGTCHETAASKQDGCILPCTSFARSDIRLARLSNGDAN